MPFYLIFNDVMIREPSHAVGFSPYFVLFCCREQRNMTKIVTEGALLIYLKTIKSLLQLIIHLMQCQISKLIMLL